MMLVAQNQMYTYSILQDEEDHYKPLKDGLNNLGDILSQSNKVLGYILEVRNDLYYHFPCEPEYTFSEIAHYWLSYFREFLVPDSVNSAQSTFHAFLGSRLKFLFPNRREDEFRLVFFSQK